MPPGSAATSRTSASRFWRTGCTGGGRPEGRKRAVCGCKEGYHRAWARRQAPPTPRRRQPTRAAQTTHPPPHPPERSSGRRTHSAQHPAPTTATLSTATAPAQHLHPPRPRTSQTLCRRKHPAALSAAPPPPGTRGRACRAGPEGTGWVWVGGSAWRCRAEGSFHGCSPLPTVANHPPAATATSCAAARAAHLRRRGEVGGMQRPLFFLLKPLLLWGLESGHTQLGRWRAR